ncbi:hypothetical protein C8R47DRAFT_1162158 [Mycena vitilis]|nr:hypothetical protein C8R47DRAFT_1162158 [Mycena vitilis]
MKTCDAKCGELANLKCSACKTARYCGKECQRLEWKAHRKECRLLAGKLAGAKFHNDQNDGKPPKTHCTGCNLRFGRNTEPEPDTICPDCGYVACSDCVCHNRRGTCYCPNTNFGHYYCERVPEWYHFCGRTGEMYKGDNHPEDHLATSHEVPASQWEKKPRKCGNCGKKKLCLIPGYRCKSWMCQE